MELGDIEEDVDRCRRYFVAHFKCTCAAMMRCIDIHTNKREDMLKISIHRWRKHIDTMIEIDDFLCVCVCHDSLSRQRPPISIYIDIDISSKICVFFHIYIYTSDGHLSSIYLSNFISLFI